MHVLYLHQYFTPPTGAGGTRSYELGRRLARAGHRVTIVTSTARFPSECAFPRRVTRMKCEGIDLVVLRVPYSNKQSYLRRALAFIDFALRSAFHAARTADVDVVFATSTPLTIGLPALVARVAQRCPMVFEVRDLWPELPIALGVLRNPILIGLTRWFERFMYQQAVHIVALSPGMRDGVVRAGCAPEKITVIPNGCDVDLFLDADLAGAGFRNAHPFLADNPVVSYVGTLGPINDVESSLVPIARAMLDIDESVRFVVVGDGRQKAAVLDAAERAGVLEKNLWVLPAVPKNRVPAVLGATTVAASLFVDLPEMWANSANKFFDSLASGTPVMINYKGWQARLLNETGAGVVVPPSDPHAAAEMLLSLLRDGSRMQRARDATRRLANTEFNRDRLGKQLLAVLLSAKNTKSETRAQISTP